MEWTLESIPRKTLSGSKSSMLHMWGSRPRGSIKSVVGCSSPEQGESLGGN
jgi:hypothetical protein